MMTRINIDIEEKICNGKRKLEKKYTQYYLFQNHIVCPGQCGSVGCVSSCEEKSCWFNSGSGHMPGLQVWSLVRMCSRGNQLIFLSLSFSLSPPLSKKWINKFFLKNYIVYICIKDQALTGVAQLVEHHPTKQKVASSIPGQGTCLECGFGLWTRCIWEATDRCFSPFLSPLLSLKINKIFF